MELDRKRKVIPLVANCFLGALPPVDLRAVCLVRAILINCLLLNKSNE